VASKGRFGAVAGISPIVMGSASGFGSVERQRAVPLKDFMAHTPGRYLLRTNLHSGSRMFSNTNGQLLYEAIIAVMCILLGAYIVGIVPAVRLVLNSHGSGHMMKSDACECCEWVSKATSIFDLDEALPNFCFRCPITLEIMRDPVICSDGHTYEREAIQRWLEGSKRSPQTNLPLVSTALIPNLSLRSVIHERSIRKILREEAKGSS